MSGQDARILVIDGEPLRLRATSQLLADAGYQVAEAAGGKEGLRRAGEARPDLIVADEALPDMDGPELCRGVQADPRLSRTWVIILTDRQTDSPCPDEDLSMPGVAYVYRGADAREMLKCVKTWLRLRRTEVDLLRRADELAERTRELKYLYNLSDLIEQPQLTVEMLLESAARLLPAALRFPHIAVARITFEDREFRTDSYRETEWRQGTELMVYGVPCGRIEVCYLEPGPWGEEGPFLREEQDLLVAAAQRVGRTVERLEAEERLRAQDQLLELIIDGIPAYITYLDADYRILFANQAIAEWWGYSKKELVGKNFREVALGGGYEAAVPFFEKARASREAVTQERIARSRAGQARVARQTYVPDLDEQGNVHGFAVLALDITDQRQAEEALRAERERLDLIIDNIPAYIVYTDADWNILHANQAYAGFWGYSKEELAGKNVKDVASPTAFRELAGYLQQARASRQPVTYESEVISAAGRTHVMLRTYAPHLDRQGDVAGFVALILDVTEQRRAEEALRTQEQLRDLINDTIPANIAYVDTDYNILYANRSMAEWWGYTKQECVGKNWREVALPGGYEAALPFFEKARASREPVTHERVARSRTGQPTVMRQTYVPHLDEQQSVQGFAALVLDVTAQRAAEEERRAAEERYRFILENMHDGVAVIDEAATLTYVNDRLCDMMGRTREEMIGQSSAILFRDEDLAQRAEQLGRRKAGYSDTYETVFVRKDGVRVPVLISGSPVRDREGSYKGSFAVVTDITAQKQVEQALLQAKEAAEEAQAAAELARLGEQKRRLEAERRRRLAEGLADVLAALNAKRPLDDVLNLVVRQARQLLGAQAAAIFGLEGPDRELRVHATQGSIGALFSEESSPAIRAVMQEAIARRRPVATFELAVDGGRDSTWRNLDPNRPADAGSLPTEGVGRGSFLAAPVLLADLAYGALVVYHAGPRPMAAEDWELTRLLAAQAALAVENTRLRAEVEESAVAAERNRLARELHDSVTQALFSVSLIAEVLPRVWQRYPDEGKRALEELHQLTRGALAEMRTLLLELRPAALVGQSLEALITQLADTLPAQTRSPVHTTITGDCAMPDDVKLAMYRIAQEALNNVIKHAQAANVWITLHGEPDVVTLAVQDDGEGFDSADVESHQFGLGIMRERAKGVGADLTIQSRPGQGATIRVSWDRL